MEINNVHNEYEAARKKGRGDQLKARSMGKDGYLDSLDSIIKNRDIVAEIPIGIVSINLKKIVGTYYFTRSRDFSENFYPLKDVRSEFCDKWCALCKAHVEEGIREPIKVYEFMNRYYVMEGNKRVSVLKYFGAHSFEAEVTRLIPKKDESDSENKLYYEFLEFSNKTGIYDIWFKKRIFFKELLMLLEKFEPKEMKGRDKYDHFYKNFYIPFRIVYKECGGDDLKITTGDAILEYIRIYGISDEFKFERVPRVEKLLEELKMVQDKSKVDIQMEPFEVYRGNVLSSISKLVSNKKMNVAFLYEKNTENSAWAYSHEKGRKFAQNILSEKINTCFFDNIPVDDGEAYERIKEIAGKNFDIIFTTSQRNLRAALRTALKFEETKFFCCSPMQAFRNMSTYYGRSQEAMYLLGVIAGSVTKSNKIGIIDKHERTAVVTGLNAFALGVKSVNDSAVVKVLWTEDYENKEMKMELIQDLGEYGADFVLKRGVTEGGMSGRNIALYEVIKESCGYNYGENFASIKWDWGRFYEKVLRNITNGSWKGMFSTDSKRVSFVWGIDSGIIDVEFSKKRLSFQLCRTVDIMRGAIVRNEIHTFEGPIYDNSDALRIGEGDYASYNKMLYMNWFVDNIEGSVPEMIL